MLKMKKACYHIADWALRLMGVLYEELDWSYLHRRANELYIPKVVEKMQRDVKRYKDVYKQVKEMAERDQADKA